MDISSDRVKLPLISKVKAFVDGYYLYWPLIYLNAGNIIDIKNSTKSDTSGEAE